MPTVVITVDNTVLLACLGDVPNLLFYLVRYSLNLGQFK